MLEIEKTIGLFLVCSILIPYQTFINHYEVVSFRQGSFESFLYGRKYNIDTMKLFSAREISKLRAISSQLRAISSEVNSMVII